MDIAIISSAKDIASANIKENLINNFKFNNINKELDNNDLYEYAINKNNNTDNKNIKLYTINSELIFTDDLDKKIYADSFIFISKHRAQEDRASLTCHAIGNFWKAEHGGKERILCPSNPPLLKNIFVELNKNAVGSGYEAAMEATHHGPFMEKPVCFVELGSNEGYWKDKNGGKIVANSLMKALSKDDADCESVFVIGGSHYNHVANKAMLQSDFAAGHICAKYNLENLDADLIKQAMEKCRAKLVLLDWKGLGKEKRRILEILEKNKIKYRKSEKAS